MLKNIGINLSVSCLLRALRLPPGTEHGRHADAAGGNCPGDCAPPPAPVSLLNTSGKHTRRLEQTADACCESVRGSVPVVAVRRTHRTSDRATGGTSDVATGKGARYKWLLDRRMEAATVCRNIKTLFNFAPPATEEEIRAAALQFVRKISGFNSPSRGNRAAFDQAVDAVAASARTLMGALSTTAEPRDRERQAERTALRFGARP